MLEDHDPIFGKNVIETLSVGMYDNPLFLFREYVQNAADAIDAAVQAGILNEGKGQIEIKIDPDRRIISFEDNGTGIPRRQVKKMLANIGDSQKDRKTDKGFRGIGRLGGLGYCQKVRFETSAKGEPTKSYLEWDARNLHDILNDKNDRIHAGALIKRITSTWEEECDADLHFFKVSLLNVNEQSDELLDVTEIHRYLSMVAPVPFDYQKFRFVSDIEKFLIDSGIPKPNEYSLYVNNEEVKKGYETPLKIEGGKTVDILDVRCKVIKDPDGNTLGWYWFCVSAFDGFLPKKCWQRGLRLRKSNIQIGDADCLTNHPKRGLALWKDDRGNSYFIGEIHVLDEDLIPNSRRDYFNQDEACRRFEEALSAEFSDFWALCRYASTIRSATEKVKAAEEARKVFQKKDREGQFYDKAERDSEFKKLKEADNKAAAAEKTIVKIQEKASDGLLAAEGDQPSPLATIVEYYVPKNLQPSTCDLGKVPERPKRGFAKDKFDKKEKRILDITFEVLNKWLPPEVVTPIRDEILKRVTR